MIKVKVLTWNGPIESLMIELGVRQPVVVIAVSDMLPDDNV